VIAGGLLLKRLFSEDGPWKAYDGPSGRRLYTPDLRIGPNSVDVTLGRTLLSDRRAPWHDVDLAQPGAFNYQELALDEWFDVGQRTYGEPPPEGTFYLGPKECCLGFVRERFVVDASVWSEYTRRSMFFKTNIDGRSTIGRSFLAVHVTAGYGDFGFSGCFTLELVNLGIRPIRLWAGMRIAQVEFEEVVEPLLYNEDGHVYTTVEHDKGPVAPVTGPGRV